MQTASRRYAFNPQDIDSIMDELAEKRRPLPAGFSPRGIQRSLISGEVHVIGVRDDGAVALLPIE